jgi:hypothetical protein
VTEQDFSADLDAIGQRYPALQGILKNTIVRQGTPSGPSDDRQLEFYQPWETDSPNPGKPTVELFKNMEAGDRQDAIAADLLHHLGAVDPGTGKPVDPTFYGLKQQLGAARSPQHQQIDQQAYARDKSSYGEDLGGYGDWDAHSRLDAYVRGGLFPKQNPEWQGGMLTPEMQPIFGKMQDYLATPPAFET